MGVTARMLFLLGLLLLNTELGRCQGHCKVAADCDGEATWKIWPPETEAQAGNNRQHSGPRLHYYRSTLTWSSGKAFCGAKAKRLCRSTELCVYRNGGRTFLFDVIPGDNWVPVLDASNEWLEIGDSHRRTCFTHGPNYGPPPWGTKFVSKPYKGYVYCCPVQDHTESDVPVIPEEVRTKARFRIPFRKRMFYYDVFSRDIDVVDASVKYQYIGNLATYTSSRQHCEDQNLRLCSSSEVCRDRRPVSGVVAGDMWVAVNDGNNEWVQVGDSAGRTCWIHGERYGKPSWGNRTDGSGVPHVGYVYCCN